MNSRSYVTVAALTLAVAVAATGCGGGGPTEREYALPDTLCGLDVPGDLYDPLFPPGSNVDQEAFPGLPGGLSNEDHCLIEVDDELVIWSDTAAADTFTGYIGSRSDGLLEYRSDEPLDYDVADGTRVDTDGEFEAMVWPGFAIAGTACEPDPGAVSESFTVGIRAYYPEDDEESIRVLSDLIQPFMRAALENSWCEPGDNPASAYSSP